MDNDGKVITAYAEKEQAEQACANLNGVDFFMDMMEDTTSAEDACKQNGPCGKTAGNAVGALRARTTAVVGLPFKDNPTGDCGVQPASIRV